MFHVNPGMPLMKMLKYLISLAALAALLGCEHQDEKTGNAISAEMDRNPAVQSQSDDSPVTNAADSKAVVSTYGSAGSILADQPADLDGGIILYGDDSFSNLMYEIQEDGSTETNSLTNTGSTNSFLP